MEKPEARLNPEEWVSAAYDQFCEGGVRAVRVDPLAKRLGVTRGSFYWHFKDRAALIRAVVGRWQQRQTDAIIDDNETHGGTARERLHRLLLTCAEDDGRLEMGIREWCAEDGEAKDILERVDGKRIAYLAALAEEAGVPKPTAQVRARIAYLAWLGTYANITSLSLEHRRADMETLWHMLLA